MPAFLAGARFTPDPLAPLGERVDRDGVSSAAAGRVRGWFRSTRTFSPSFLSCSSESWRASPFRRNCGAVNSSSHSRRGKNPSPVTLRLMTPPEPDSLCPRERALPQSGRALLDPGSLPCSLRHTQACRCYLRPFLQEWDRHSCLSPSPLQCQRRHRQECLCHSSAASSAA